MKRFITSLFMIVGLTCSAMADTCNSDQITTADGCVDAKFTLTTSETNQIKFAISAAGTFYVDCGDGGTLSGSGVSGKKITRTNTNNAEYYKQTYICSYSDSVARTVRFGGRATGYSTNKANAAITFSYDITSSKLIGISGSLGAIFGTLETPTTGIGQPRFTSTFYYAYHMLDTDINDPNNPGKKYAIPPTLFEGVYGEPTERMFYATFGNCFTLKGSIPENLFAGISGKPAAGMFDGTFRESRGLTGPIPENLFAGISGAPAERMFGATFYGCSGLTGPIPENLFAGISGAPAKDMFVATFSGCSGLTGSIPENLFAGISGAPAQYMFTTTFASCSGLTGSIPENLFSGISGAPSQYMFSNTFNGCSGLTGSIPGNLFAEISGAPAEGMFYRTFNNCSGLTGTIPENLFAGISGAPTNMMFYETFYNCSGLTGSIPGNLFAGISGAPAEGMFYRTFNNCSGLMGSVPKNLFAGISTDTTATNQMTNVFRGTNFVTSCPNNMQQYITGFEDYFDGKVSCDCYNGYHLTDDPNVCAGNTITINWTGASADAINATNAGTAIYGGNINTPLSAEHVPGKTFTGWKFINPNK